MVAWLREFCRTLEIITRTVREVVNRVRLCGHHTRGYSRGEVHVYGAVMWRGGEGGDWYCIDSVLMVGDSDVIKTPLVCLYACMWGFHLHSGDHFAHFTQSGKQRDCVVLMTKLRGFRLVAWLREFCHTLEIITRTVREVANRVRLCGHHTRRSSRGAMLVLCLGCLVAWLQEFCRTLEIIARTVREVVNRVRLCGHHT